MKNSIKLVVIPVFLAATVFSGCNSPEQKVDNARENVQDAKQELNTEQANANAEAQKAASAEEWKVFKSETQLKIEDNEKRIAELKIKLKKPGKLLDPAYQKRIDALELKNQEMKSRIDAYEKNQSNWETFKREFSHDMDELGMAIKDFTVDNKN